MELMKKIDRGKIKATILSLIPDALAIAGAFFIGFGIWKIYRPAGFIAIGILSICGVIVWSKWRDVK